MTGEGESATSLVTPQVRRLWRVWQFALFTYFYSAEQGGKKENSEKIL